MSFLEVMLLALAGSIVAISFSSAVAKAPRKRWQFGLVTSRVFAVGFAAILGGVVFGVLRQPRLNYAYLTLFAVVIMMELWRRRSQPAV